jgi:hypothetical protein
MSVYQWVHLYESLYDCVSCHVYIVERLMLFHYGCVSVSSSVWKFMCLQYIQDKTHKLSYRWTHWHAPIMEQHKKFHNIYRTRPTNFHTDEWVHLYESLYDCVSCLVYIVERLMLFHYGCVSVSSYVWKVVWLCVLSCIYCRTSYVVSLWVCISEFICMKVCMFVCLVLYILSHVLCCFIMSVYQWLPLYESLYDCVYCPVSIVERLWYTLIMEQHKTFDNIYKTRHTIIQTFIQMNSLTRTHNGTT